MTNTKNLKEKIAKAHQIFYDETGIMISLSINRAINKILSLLEDKPKHKYASCGNPLDCPVCSSRPIEEQVIEKPKENYIDARTPEEIEADSKIISTITTSEEPQKKAWEGWRKAFCDEFSIHFSKSELQFVLAFIDEELQKQKSELIKEILPEEGILELTSNERVYMKGWNACRDKVLENIKNK